MLAKITALKRKMDVVHTKESVLYYIDEFKKLYDQVSKEKKSKDRIEARNSERYKDFIANEIVRCYVSLSSSTKGLEAINYMKASLKYKTDPGILNNLAHMYLTEYNDYKSEEEYYVQCL